jgi:integrase
MAKQYSFEYNGFFLGQLNGRAIAVSGKGASRARHALGVPYQPIEAAKNALRAFADAFARTQTGGNPTIDTIFRRYVGKLETERKKTASVLTNVKRLSGAFGGIPVNSLTPEMCQDYAKSRARENYSPWSIWADLNLLRTAVKWAHEKAEMFDRPKHKALWNVKVPPSRDRVLSADEFNALLEGARMPHVRLFILLGIYTGQRHQAICGLRWDQVDFEAGTIDYRVPEGSYDPTDVLSKASKKGRGIVHMTEYLRAALAAAKLNAVTPFVVEYNGRHVENIRQGFQIARTRAGLGPDVTPHVLRHTAATWAHRGADVEAVARMLGHADVRTTRGVYIHGEAGQSRTAVDAVDNVLRPKLRVVK